MLSVKAVQTLSRPALEIHICKKRLQYRINTTGTYYKQHWINGFEYSMLLTWDSTFGAQLHWAVSLHPWEKEFRPISRLIGSCVWISWVGVYAARTSRTKIYYVGNTYRQNHRKPSAMKRLVDWEWIFWNKTCTSKKLLRYCNRRCQRDTVPHTLHIIVSHEHLAK